METADRFGLPVMSFIDTAGAYPGIEAEERGQAEAIARSTDCCLGLGVPLVAVMIGEGGSGGAIALAAANSVLMLEHAIYSVISPEGAASILWRDAGRAKDAASAMRITAQDLKKARHYRRYHRRSRWAARIAGATKPSPRPARPWRARSTASVNCHRMRFASSGATNSWPSAAIFRVEFGIANAIARHLGTFKRSSSPSALGFGGGAL